MSVISGLPLHRALSKIKELPEFDGPKMPVLFIGHGSPMNVIQDNPFTRDLRKLGDMLPTPKAIVSISAHWLTKGTWVNTSSKPKQIYDIYGFPPELYKIKYQPDGSPYLAQEIVKKSQNIIKPTEEWGIDHGTWTVLYHLFPKANIPVIQISIDYRKPLHYHIEIAKALRFLRSKGILIIGSGNITHNLSKMTWENPESKPYEWAYEFDLWVKSVIENRDYELLTKPKTTVGKIWKLNHPEPSHWIPLIYTAFLHDKETEPISFPHESFQYGSISMRCVAFGKLTQ